MESGKILVAVFAVIGAMSFPLICYYIINSILNYSSWKERMEERLDMLEKRIESAENSCADRHYSCVNG